MAFEKIMYLERYMAQCVTDDQKRDKKEIKETTEVPLGVDNKNYIKSRRL